MDALSTVAESLRNPFLIKKQDDLKNIRAIAGADGTWNFDPYLHGMFNGLELILSFIEDREPQFKNAPDKWLRDNDGSCGDQHDGIVFDGGESVVVVPLKPLSEATLSDLIKKNVTVRMLFPDREDRVMEIGKRGGCRLRGMDEETLYFSLHWGRYGPDHGLPEWYDVVWRFKNVEDVIRKYAVDPSIKRQDGKTPDLRKLAVKVLNTADIEESCNCPSDLVHGFRYIRTKMKAQFGEKETRPPVKRNPGQRGAVCKHGEALVDRYLPFFGQTIANWLNRYWLKTIEDAVRSKAEKDQASGEKQIGTKAKQPIKPVTMPAPTESFVQPRAAATPPDNIHEDERSTHAAVRFGG